MMDRVFQHPTVCPLTTSQESIYFDQMLKPDDPCYNIGCYISLNKQQALSLQKQLDACVFNFDVLSIHFVVKDKQLMQEFGHHNSFPLITQDFSTFSNPEQQAIEQINVVFEQPFKLGEERLLASYLYKIHDDQYFWCIKAHHIMMDGMGIYLLINHLKSLLSGKNQALSSRVGNFQEVIFEEHTYLDSDQYSKDAAYWNEKFKTLPEPLLLPSVHKQTSSLEASSHKVSLEMSASLHQTLEKKAKEMGATLHHFGLAALILYFSKEKQRDDVVIATPVHRRKNAIQKNTLGMFTTDLPGRFDLSSTETVEELINQVKKEQRSNLRHQSYPMHQLGRALNLTGQGRAFLSEVVFNYIKAPTEVNFVATDTGRDPLQVRITESANVDAMSPSTPVIEIYCRNAYLNQQEVALFAQRYLHVLEQFASIEPQACLSDISIITSSERDQLLNQFNCTQQPQLIAKSWPELFANQVKQTPEAIAVQQEEQSITYRELDTRSNMIAHALHAKGIGSGNLVALLDHRGIDLVTMMIAVLKSGAAWVPLDPNHPAKRWLDILQESDPAALLVGNTLLLEQRSLKRKWNKEKVFNIDEFLALNVGDSELCHYPAMNDLAYIIFTSGSTGKPKGVMIEQAGLINNMLAKFEPLSLEPQDVIAQTASQCFDISIWQTLTALLLGAKVDVVPFEICRDPSALLAYLEKQKVTIWEPVPSMMQAALDCHQPLSSLRWVLPTGEALSASLVSQWFDCYKHIPLMNAYGPAECSDDVAFQPIHQAVDRVLIGQPVANVKLYILDDQQALLPLGAVGEIAVSGPVVGRGYLNLPKQTQAVFIDNPYSQDETDQRLYLTGDLARRLPDGSLEYIGRKDHQLKIRGYRIEPGEIETQLLCHSMVVEAVVDAKYDKHDQLLLVAYVVLDTQSEIELESNQLRHWLKSTLPLYMVPQVIVTLDKLPLTPNGKIDRKALPQPTFEQEQQCIAPQTETEEKLVAMWIQLLDRKSISNQANFFDIGGHSLLASRMLSMIRDTWHVDLRIKDIFEAQHLADLANMIDHASQTSLPTITPVVQQNGSLPLSFAQQRLWFIDQLENDATEYNMSAAFSIKGNLNESALEKALSHIIARHHILHTVYQQIDGQVEQHRLAEIHFQLNKQDLTKLSASEQQDKLAYLISDKTLYPFDLSRDLMLRANLFKLSHQEHRLLIVVHHIASDGWSKALLLEELSTLYGVFSQQPFPQLSLSQETPEAQKAILPPLAVQYSDYAHWQRNWMNEERLDKEIHFWRESLKGLPPVHSLPLDKPRPAQQSHNGQTLSLDLSAEVSERVLQLAKQHNVTLFMLMNAALACLFHRYSGEDDIVIGTPVANRDQPQIASLVGFFVNTLLIRSDLSGNPSFADMLARSKQSALDAFSHSQLPFDTLVETLKPERSLSYNPLFQIMLAVQNNTQSSLHLAELEIEEQTLDGLRSQFDISVEVQQIGAQLKLNWTWATDLFEPATIESMAMHLNQLLCNVSQQEVSQNKISQNNVAQNNVSVQPQQKVTEISFITESQRQSLINHWVANLNPITSQDVLHQRFEQQAKCYPDSIALSDEQEQMTYQELNQRANRLAHYLIEQGVGPDVLVGLSVHRCCDMVIGLLAILKAGGAYLPLDPAYPSLRLAHMLEDSATKLILSTSEIKQQLPISDQRVIDIDHQALFSEYSPENPSRGVSADNLAYVIYTSGSTGKPKGVMVEHRQVIRLFDASEQHFQFNSSDVWSLFHSFAFDFSVWEIWGALLHGGKLIIVPQWVARSTTDFYQLLCDEGVTVLNQTPTAFGHLIGVDSEHRQPLKLRYVIFGGEALNMKSLVPWINRHGDNAPQLINMYGITETTVHVTYRRIYQQDVQNTCSNSSLIGQPLQDLAMYLFTPNLDVVPTGVPGEIYVGGAGVARGYLNRSDLNQTRFIDNPFVPGERLYRTGDLARYRHDGELEYLGRCDQQVKIRGFRIELGEIESSLLSLPEVTEAVVLPRDEPKRLVAYVVISSGDEHAGSDNIAKLREAMVQQLPEHMVPAAFVLLDKLPTTANGKTDRNALLSMKIEEQSHHQFVAPSTLTEQALCEIWQTQLKVDKVGVLDNFFHLGGDSIRAISIVAASKKAGINYSIRDLFAFPEIQSLANEIQQKNTHVEELQQVEVFGLLDTAEKHWLSEHGDHESIEDAYPQSSLQQGMIVHSLLSAAEGTYHDIFGYRVKARWDEALFRNALSKLVYSQESFRTLYLSGVERPLSVVYKHIDLPFECIDLCHMTKDQQDKVMQEHSMNEKSAPFDFTQPLWRIFIFQLAQDEFYYQLSFHHALWDGWSVASLNTQLFDLYTRALRKETLPELKKPLSYRQFIALEQQSEQNQQTKGYWQSHLQQVQLPWWASAEQNGTTLLSYSLASHHDKKLKALAHHLKVQEKSVFLAIHMVLLAQISGCSDITTSVVTNGRPEMEGSDKTLGLFLNSLPLRVGDVKQDWHQLIRQLDEQWLMMMPHRHYPLAKIQQITGIEYSSSLFNYIDFHVYKQMDQDIQILRVDDFEQTNYLFDANYSRHPLTEQFEISINLDSGCFNHDFVECIKEYLDQIVCDLAENSDSLVETTRYLGQKEIQSLSDWNNTTDPALLQHSWPELFHQQVMKSPEAVVAICEGNQLTYQQLNEQSEALARSLRHKGIRNGDVVGLLDHRGLDLLIMIVAVLKSGAAYMPMDPEQPLERWQKILNESQPTLLIVGDKLQDTQRKLSGTWQQDKICAYSELFAEVPTSLCTDALPWPSLGDLAYVLFTSGSTGRPKGVMIEHRGMINNMLSKFEPLALTQHDVIAQTASQCFDISVWQFLTAPILGAKVVIVPSSITQDPKALLTQLNQHAVTIWEPVPSVIKAALYYQIELPSLRWVMPTGEALSSELVSVWFEQYPQIPLMNAYGPAECSDDVAFQVIDSPIEKVMIGTPVANAHLHVVSPSLELVPVGVVGELAVSGAVVGRGYRDQPEKTQAVFVSNPWPRDEFDSRMYLTGDLVKRHADGRLEFIGRKDFQVKVRGYRIELEEIEATLSQHEMVNESVVIARSNHSGDAVLVAYVVLNQPERDSATLGSVSKAIKEYLQQQLPQYMVPDNISFLEAMPLSANGKLDRNALPDPVNDREKEYKAPVSETEKQLASIWQILLNNTEISRYDNFFDIGGHSLLAARMINHIRDQWQVDLAFKSVFEATHLAEVASMIDADKALLQLHDLDLDSLSEQELDQYLALLAEQ